MGTFTIGGRRMQLIPYECYLELERLRREAGQLLELLVTVGYRFEVKV